VAEGCESVEAKLERLEALWLEKALKGDRAAVDRLVAVRRLRRDLREQGQVDSDGESGMVKVVVEYVNDWRTA
jgi:hypothetical protein